MANLELLSEMDHVLKHEVVQRHSYFQLKYFLIGKEPTNQAKMWQCLRELKTRRESLSSIELEMEETKDKIELLNISTEKIQGEMDYTSDLPNYKLKFLKKECEIKIRQIERQKKAAQDNLFQLIERKKWIEEESKFFLETFKNIEKIEPLMNFDDLDAQKQYWGEKLAQKLNLKLISTGQIDSELIETIIALPDEIPVKQNTLNMLNTRHNKLLESIKNKEL